MTRATLLLALLMALLPACGANVEQSTQDRPAPAYYTTLGQAVEVGPGEVVRGTATCSETSDLAVSGLCAGSAPAVLQSAGLALCGELPCWVCDWSNAGDVTALCQVVALCEVGSADKAE